VEDFAVFAINRAMSLIDDHEVKIPHPKHSSICIHAIDGVEYGLIGKPEDCKIYGAGLLSSIGESVTCMQPDVKKIPYTIAAADTSFDITKQQPQLFVTSSFIINNILSPIFGNISF
jgi:hypothetical protein